MTFTVAMFLIRVSHAILNGAFWGISGVHCDQGMDIPPQYGPCFSNDSAWLLRGWILLYTVVGMRLSTSENV